MPEYCSCMTADFSVADIRGDLISIIEIPTRLGPYLQLDSLEWENRLTSRLNVSISHC